MFRHRDRPGSYVGRRPAQPGAPGRRGPWPAAKTSALGLALVGALALSLAPSAGADAIARGTARCTGADSYRLRAVRLAGCGIASYPVASTERLADGGTMVTYHAGAQTVFTVTPPAGENLVNVPQSVRNLYGLPSAPRAHSGESRRAWRRQLRSLRWVTAPAALHDVPGVRFGDVTYANWAGYTADESAGYFHYAYMKYVEPTPQRAVCDPNDGAVFWTGLGGVKTRDLGQDGTAQGQFNGLAEDQGWIETDVGDVYASSVRATEGQQMFVTTIYEPNYNGTGRAAYIYNFENLHTGAGQSLGTWDSNFSGATADWIAERPGYTSGGFENLSGFTPLQVVWAAAAVQKYPVSHYPYDNAEMYDGWEMAGASPLSGNGYSFTVTHYHCNQG